MEMEHDGGDVECSGRDGDSKRRKLVTEGVVQDSQISAAKGSPTDQTQ